MNQDIPKSKAAFLQARRHLVGGVNSPIRAFGAVGDVPRFMEKAKGAVLTDADGHSYIDFVGGAGTMILGHAADAVQKAVKQAMAKGFLFAAPSSVEVEIASLISEAVPSVEQIRFSSSGTEATMSALRLAKAVTKRERIVKFEGGYHGHSDGLLVSAGSGATMFGVPSSAGVPAALARNTWVLPFNDIESLEELFRTQGINIAAVIVEPVCTHMGVVSPSLSFLQKLRRLTKKFGVVLIFDEVTTGFRLGWGGAQELYNVTPDLTCLGGIIGGGFPIGAFGGGHEIMEKLAPLGPVFQGGALAGHPVVLAAGLATLKILRSKNPYEALEKRTRQLVSFLISEAEDKGIPVQINQVGSLFSLFFTEEPVSSFLTANQSDSRRYAAFFHALLQQGLFFPPSQFEAAFLSMAHTPPVLDRCKRAFSKAFGVFSNLL